MPELTQENIEKLRLERDRKIHLKNHTHDRLMWDAEICLNCNKKTCRGNCQRYKDELKKLRLTNPKRSTKRGAKRKNNG